MPSIKIDHYNTCMWCGCITQELVNCSNCNCSHKCSNCSHECSNRSLSHKCSNGNNCSCSYKCNDCHCSCLHKCNNCNCSHKLCLKCAITNMLQSCKGKYLGTLTKWTIRCGITSCYGFYIDSDKIEAFINNEYIKASNKNATELVINNPNWSNATFLEDCCMYCYEKPSVCHKNRKIIIRIHKPRNLQEVLFQLF